MKALTYHGAGRHQWKDVPVPRTGRPVSARRTPQGPAAGPLGRVEPIPTSTGAARSVGLVLPQPAGALDGISVRVPVENGSLTDLTLVPRRETDVAGINAAFDAAAEGPLRGIPRVSRTPIVSRDVIGDPHSCVIDAELTQVNGDLVKDFGWYDNEWGYTNRLLDPTEYVATRL